MLHKETCSPSASCVSYVHESIVLLQHYTAAMFVCRDALTSGLTAESELMLQ
jgi:hypothetical protein